MVLGYIAGVVYFTKHFYLGSQINGMNASGKSVEAVEDSIVDEIASYTLHFKGAGRQDRIHSGVTDEHAVCR